MKDEISDEYIGACTDCGRKYGNRYGFPDLIIPDKAWKQISPTSNDCGLLCPSCICKRLFEKRIKTRGEFKSGPLEHKKVFEIGTRLNLLERIKNVAAKILDEKKDTSFENCGFIPSIKELWKELEESLDDLGE